MAESLNETPTAQAGDDLVSDSNQIVTLSGKQSSDPDVDDTLTYQWVQLAGPSVVLSDSSAVEPTFTTPTLNIGDDHAKLTFGLTVSDGTDTSAQDTVVVTVRAPVGRFEYQAPLVSATPDLIDQIMELSPDLLDEETRSVMATSATDAMATDKIQALVEKVKEVVAQAPSEKQDVKAT